MPLCLIGKTQGARFKFEQLGVKDGLSNNTITSVVKDNRGFIWIGTTTGLNRYDGHTVKVYYSNPESIHSISNDHIAKLYVDRNGVLWIGTSYGLCQYDEANDHFIQVPLPDNVDEGLGINTFLETADSTFWIGSNYGLYQLDRTTLTYQHYTSPEINLSSNKILALSEGQNNTLLIGHKSSFIDRLSRKTKQVERITFQEKEQLNTSIYYPDKIFRDAKQTIWLIIKGYGLFRFDQELNQFIPKPIYLNGQNIHLINDFLEIRPGYFFLFTDSGLIAFDEKANHFELIAGSTNGMHSLSSLLLKNAYRDRDGNIWIGTQNNGLNIYKPKKYKFYNFVLDPKREKLSVLKLLTTNHKIWAGTDGNGLYSIDLLDGNKQHFNTSNSDLKSNSVMMLYLDKKQQLWSGSFWGGLNLIDQNARYPQILSAQHKFPKEILDKNIYDIEEDNFGHTFFSTFPEGFISYHKPTGISRHYQKSDVLPSLSDNHIFDLQIDGDSLLWIAMAGGGVNCFDIQANRLKRYLDNPSDKTALPSNKVYCIFKDSKNQIWFGTSMGISLYDRVNDSFTSFNHKHGLADNNIKAINEDHSARLWLATNKGLSMLNFDHSGNPTIKNYDWKDGIEAGSFHNSTTQLPDGRMLFGGAKGVCAFYPEQIELDTNKAAIILSKIKILNREVHKGDTLNGRILFNQNISKLKSLILKHEEKSIDFEFVLLHFTNPKNNRFAYKLAGFDEQWNYLDVGQRSITYTNLSEGTYSLAVKAANGDGVWMEKQFQLGLQVLPPWYRTTLAYAFYLVLACLMLFLFRYLILLKSEVQHVKILAKKNREIEEAKLRFFMNISHEFKTPLTLILAPLQNLKSFSSSPRIKTQLAFIQRNAERLQGLINQLLDLRKIESNQYTLQLQNADLIALVEKIYIAFKVIAEQKEIVYEFKCKERFYFCDFDPDIIEKVLYNLLSNAFKYTPQQGWVQLKLELKSPFVELKVLDNGIGIAQTEKERIFERFYRIHSGISSKDNSTGIGLALAKELIEIHHGSIQVESKENEGSKFIVNFPLLETKTAVSRSPVEDKTILAPLLQNIQLENDNSKALIYIVDDNEDLRAFLGQELGIAFKVKVFSQGVEALSAAIQEIPDLIVSDVRMPIMDGLEFCKRAKENSSTSHIPILLLTAKSSDEEHLYGFGVGADDYVTKPFNLSILKAKIDSLLLNRQRIWEKLKTTNFNAPEAIIKNDKDQEFLQRLTNIINQHIKDPSLNYKVLCQALAMSKTQLYRKINSLTGKSVHEFIKIIRLKQAAKLLQEEQMLVSEIAFQVGFKHPPNFSVAFKTFFGTSPSDYRNGVVMD